jgi:hypothetical protein
VPPSKKQLLDDGTGKNKIIPGKNHDAKRKSTISDETQVVNELVGAGNLKEILLQNIHSVC